MNLNPSCVNIYVCDHISPTDPLIREKRSLQSLMSALSDHKHIICMLTSPHRQMQHIKSCYIENKVLLVSCFISDTKQQDDAVSSTQLHHFCTVHFEVDLCDPAHNNWCSYLNAGSHLAIKVFSVALKHLCHDTGMQVPSSVHRIWNSLILVTDIDCL